jgi:hypothetical protein
MVQSYRDGELAIGVHWRKRQLSCLGSEQVLCIHSDRQEKLIPVKDLISAKTQMFLIRALPVTQTMRF